MTFCFRFYLNVLKILVAKIINLKICIGKLSIFVILILCKKGKKNVFQSLVSAASELRNHIKNNASSDA